MRKLWITFILIGIVLGASFGFWQQYQLESKVLLPPNILILSFCSLRFEDLDASPELQSLKKESYFFSNSFAKHSWVNLFQYLYRSVNPQTLKSKGYALVGLQPDWPATVVPPGEDSPENYGELNENFSLDFKPALSKIKSQLLAQNLKPFYAFIHFRYLHYPLIDRLNKEAAWDFFLSNSEKVYIQKVLADPVKYRSKLPLLLMLSGSPDLLRQFPEIEIPSRSRSEAFLKQYAFFSDPVYLKRWQEDADFAKDLRILRQIYRAKLRYFTSQIADLLNLYNNNELQKKTLLIIVGDHGESLMEHDVLGHSFNVFDETLRVPLMIKLPGKQEKEPPLISAQFFTGAIAQFINLVASGNLPTEALIKEMTLSLSNELIVSRNCNNTQMGIRYKNQWKLIKDFSGAENKLFNLTIDPSEKINVIAFNKNVAAKLELQLNQHLLDLGQVWDLSHCL